ncbi:MAG: hypothetical protein ACJAXB_001477 [Candidatus Endobugula sp.]|jgi:hypothetical protein
MAGSNEQRSKTQNITVMKSSTVKTQKNLSALIALSLALVTLFQAGFVKSTEIENDFKSKEEIQLIAEIEAMLEEDMEMTIIEEVYEEMEAEKISDVKIFNAENELVAQGNPSSNSEVRQLVNQANYLTSDADSKYYSLSK